MSTSEKPPPPTEGIQHLEDLNDYLIRVLADIQRQLADLDARLQVLEP